MATKEERKRLEALIDAIADPATKEHYQKQLAMADDIEADGLLEGLLPLQSDGAGEPERRARTYVFQWFRKGETEAMDSLVVHTAGSARALTLFEQNAAAGALMHDIHVSPRCEVLALDADDCRVCFGAGKLTLKGKKRSTCEACVGTGKSQGRA